MNWLCQSTSQLTALPIIKAIATGGSNWWFFEARSAKRLKNGKISRAEPPPPLVQLLPPGECWGKLALLLPAPHLLFEPTKGFRAKGSSLKW